MAFVALMCKFPIIFLGFVALIGFVIWIVCDSCKEDEKINGNRVRKPVRNTNVQRRLTDRYIRYGDELIKVK